MGRIEVVSFDMEGTLLTHDFSNLIWETDVPRLYGEKNGLGLDEARRRVMAEYDTVGPGAPEWYDTGYWFVRLGLDSDWRRLLEARSRDCSIYPEVPGVLERLGGRYRLVVSSNTIREFLEVQLRCLPDAFEQVYSAPSDHGTVKDTEFFERICRELGVEPEAVAHVGDSEEFDFEAAKTAGMKSFLLDREGERKSAHVVQNLQEFIEKIGTLEERNGSQ